MNRNDRDHAQRRQDGGADRREQQVESVWDYPRPPRLEATAQHLCIVHGGIVVADTTSALRVLETSHPPVFYLPPQDVRTELLRPSGQRRSFCEFKGIASYWDLDVSAALTADRPSDGKASPVHAVAWSYAAPSLHYAALRDHFAFYAGLLDECTVDGERVAAQPGSFYGGWITSHVRGPFKTRSV